MRNKVRRQVDGTSEHVVVPKKLSNTFGAYDHISRAGMLDALRGHATLEVFLPFATLFYGQASCYVFYDERGVGHDMWQGAGGEQGDPRMPGLYALGQHSALLSIHAQLLPTERLHTFLDDVYITNNPESTVPALHIAQEVLGTRANVQVHLGKTRAWNAAGGEPPGLVEAVPVDAHEPPCWTGNWALPPAQQGLIVLGSPLGSHEFVVAALAERLSKHDELLARFPAMQDMQSAWLLLLLCAAPRCQCLLRTVPPSVTDTFATEHDSAVARCLAVLLSGGNEPMDLAALAQRRARMGGLGLASAAEHRHAAYWASRADTAVALREHHPGTLAELMRPTLADEAPDVAPSAGEAQLRSLGLDVPTWAIWAMLCKGAPPRAHPAQAAGPPARKRWQRYASAFVDQRAFETLFSDLDPASRALLLSQEGDGASCALTALPTSADLVVPDAEYRVMLLRRLRLPLPFAPRHCRCGRALDTLGDHRTACAQVGVLAHRAGPLERAAARICREAGARVAASVALWMSAGAAGRSPAVALPRVIGGTARARANAARAAGAVVRRGGLSGAAAGGVARRAPRAAGL